MSTDNPGLRAGRYAGPQPGSAPYLQPLRGRQERPCFAIIVAMIRLYSLFMLLDLALLVVALIDCLSAEEYAIRALPRVAWVFIILLFSPIGAIAWFVAGRPPRPVRLSNGELWRPGSGFPEGERPRRKGSPAPDDDP